MFAHVAVHDPKPEYTGSPGLIQIGAWRDTKTNRLVDLAFWESAEAFEASAGRIFAVVADDPFDTWSERPPDSFLPIGT